MSVLQQTRTKTRTRKRWSSKRLVRSVTIAPADIVARDRTAPWLSQRPGLLLALWIVVGVLVVMHGLSVLVGERSWQLTRAFNLDRESNVPTWFSSGLWALGAWAAWECARLSGRARARRLWTVAAVGLLLLSCDEVAMLHENLGNVLRHHGFAGRMLSFEDIPWPVAVPILAVIVGWIASSAQHMLKGSRHAQRRLMLALVLLGVGAAGADMLTDLLQPNLSTWALELMHLLEESLEMAGSLTVLSGLLWHQHWLLGPDARRCA